MNGDALLASAVTAIGHLADPEPPWVEILESGRRLVGADSAAFMIFDGQGALTIHQDHLDRSAERDYVEHFHMLDIGLNTAMNCSSGTWINTHDVVSPAAMQKTQYYTDFMCRHRMRQIVCHIVRIDPVHRACFSFQRDKIDETVRARLEGPSISAFAAAMEAGLADRRQLAMKKLAATDDALCLYDEAVCLLSGSGVLCFASQRASEIFNGNTSIRLRGGRIWHHSERVRATLGAAILRAAVGDRVITVAMPNGLDGPLVLDLKRADAWARLGNEALVLMRIKQSSAKDDMSSEITHAVFDLSPAEGRVLDALVEGKSAMEIALFAGISLHTVRKHIFMLMEKTGAKRQADLVRLVLQR